MKAEQPLEIERKFLVETLPSLDDLVSTEVRQGYLTNAADSIEMRLRQKGSKHFMTLKSDGDLARTEYEIAINEEQFDTLWPATEGRRVEKVRHVGTLDDGLTFELDVFSGDLAGLKLVEVEFSSLEAANSFVAPDWFGADVTANKGYKNKALAVHGRP